MGKELTQAEIDKLINGGSPSPLTEEDIDMLGEIGNIGMGNSATALSKILNRKVSITTPKVVILEDNNMPTEYAIPYVTVEITYIEGISGKNILNLRDEDVKIITDIMMGGKGEVKEGPIDEMNLSAAGELMNQMIGASSTALSEMMNTRLNISTPDVKITDYSTDKIDDFINGETLVMTIFDLDVEDTLKSEIMLVMTLDFAKKMIEKVKQQYTESLSTPVQSEQEVKASKSNTAEPPSKVNIQKVELQTFGEDNKKPNMFGNRYDILMDVPLEVSIEIGRVKKPISEILKFTSGTIIELDKLVGEDVNIVINNKTIGKGEVVVIDEYYGMRISEILDKNSI
ncbi:MAG: flagellar motor switch phosphatase FliY [Clostridia bacterium]|nr:flagellar motor switch phosphatase FliY [Clostridia bacterium]